MPIRLGRVTRFAAAKLAQVAGKAREIWFKRGPGDLVLVWRRREALTWTEDILLSSTWTLGARLPESLVWGERIRLSGVWRSGARLPAALRWEEVIRLHGTWDANTRLPAALRWEEVIRLHGTWDANTRLPAALRWEEVVRLSGTWRDNTRLPALEVAWSEGVRITGTWRPPINPPFFTAEFTEIRGFTFIEYTVTPSTVGRTPEFYDIQYDTNPQFDSPSTSSFRASQAATTPLSGTFFPIGRNHYLRSRARDRFGNSAWSPAVQLGDCEGLDVTLPSIGDVELT